MQNQNINDLRADYDECISKVNNLASLVKQLSNDYELQNLEEVVVPEDYLPLLANSLYAVNSLTYAYCNIKSMEFPAQFAKVKQYYGKAKNPLAAQPPKSVSPSPVVINKEAVQRVIERSIK